MKTDNLQPWKKVIELVDQGRQSELEEFLANLPSGDLALALSRLSDEQQSRLLTLLPPDQAADVLERLPDVQAVELIENLDPPAASAILDELPSDEQADLLGDLSPGDAEAILSGMAPAEAADARVLSKYADDVAGGLMITEYVRYREDQTVADVVHDMRSRAGEYRDYDVQYAYVCDTQGRLTGILRLRDLLLAEERRSLPN